MLRRRRCSIGGAPARCDEHHEGTDDSDAGEVEQLRDRIDRGCRPALGFERRDELPKNASGKILKRVLRDELEELGLANAAIDEHGYVTATIPATVEKEVPVVAFFAHADTAREVTGAGVEPPRLRYEGGEIALGDSGRAIRPEESPELAKHTGHELITTDGTTLLGADDKAGIAEIMAAVAYLVAQPEVPHGTVKVAFNPDEEIGRGVVETLAGSRSRAGLMRAHGVFAIGTGPREALKAAVMCEDAAWTVHLARALGPVESFEQETIDALHHRYQNVYGQR